MRQILKKTIFLLALTATAGITGACTGGILEIHHLATGRGNCTYIVMPDGTTMMIDCGDDPVSGAKEHNEVQPMMPDSLHSTADNILNYISKAAPRGKERKLDYFLLTHFHNDHMSAFGELSRKMQIDRIIDRAYPDYPEYESCEDINEYAQDVLKLVSSGKTAAYRFETGSSEQISPIDGCTGLEIRNVCANGRCWTGQGNGSREIYRPRPEDENESSCGILLRWGNFSYLSCGDVPGGYMEPNDMQSALARVCGHCDVLVACHHAYQDSMTETFCRAADTKAYIVPTREYWHPSGISVENMCNPDLNTNNPEIFCTGLLQSQKENFYKQGYSDHFAPDGHIIIRVGGHGRWFRIIVRDARTGNSPVIYKTGRILS